LSPSHVAPQFQHFIEVAQLKKALQMRGVSVNGLKADLQQRLLETVNNTATTMHTTNTAKEGTVNSKDNTKTADNAALPTEAPTHKKNHKHGGN
jgi:hypothetical protein